MSFDAPRRDVPQPASGGWLIVLEGYEAAKSGQAMVANPYRASVETEALAASYWSQGWREATGDSGRSPEHDYQWRSINKRQAVGPG
jgi:ribosome modulation factor